MCGYCTESIALDILRDDIAGSLRSEDVATDHSRYFYMRETSDIISALELLKHDLRNEEMPKRATFYRGLEVLITEGFESAAYQGLLKQSYYRLAVDELCGEVAKSEYESSTTGLDTDFLQLLYEPETYFWKDRASELKVLSDVLPACLNILRHYISWWLLGDNLKFEDENSVATHEHDRFTVLCRAVYFSILVIGSCSAGKKMLQEIVVNDSHGSPSAEGEDLWLQRIAANKLYELEGLKPFISKIASIRPTMYLYLDLLHPFSIEQKDQLLHEASRFSETREADNNICLVEWLSRS